METNKRISTWHLTCPLSAKKKQWSLSSAEMKGTALDKYSLMTALMTYSRYHPLTL
jgi:hypothetical protein